MECSREKIPTQRHNGTNNQAPASPTRSVRSVSSSRRALATAITGPPHSSGGGGNGNGNGDSVRSLRSGASGLSSHCSKEELEELQEDHRARSSHRVRPGVVFVCVLCVCAVRRLL